MFLTYYGTPQYTPEGGVPPDGGHQNDTPVIQNRLQASYKAVNFFPHQNFWYLDGNGTNAQRQNKPNLTVRLSIGSKLLPEHEVRSPQESLMYTLHALGLNAMRDSIACSGHNYQRTAFIQGFNCEKWTGAGEDYDGLGLSARDGSSIQVQMTGNVGGTLNNGNPIERLYLTVISSLKVELKTGSMRVSD